MFSPTDTFLNYCKHFEHETFESHLIYQWYLLESRVLESWVEYGRGSDDIVIAVIDLEFDINHSDFKNKLHAPLDMELGKSFTYEGEKFHITTPFQPISKRTHGTNVASIAIAEKNSKGIVGVAPNAKFMPIRAFGLSEETWTEAIQYAIDHGAHILCSSIGFLDSDYENEMSQKLRQSISNFSKELIMCFASGNSAISTIELSSHPDVIGVGACNIFNELTSYSNIADNIILVAPSDEKGLRMIAADNTGLSGKSPVDITYDFGGTSAASPIVAGIIAQMLSHNKDLDIHKIKEILFETGISLVGDDKHRRVDCYEAVKRSLELTNIA